jgi:hypothetical protein
MGFFAQTWTLTKKNLLIVLGRHWFTTTVRAFLAPIIFFFIISYCKNFFVPPSDFGVGSPTTLRTFEEALHAGTSGRKTVAFVANNQASEVTDLIDQLSNEVELLETCRSSIRGVSNCFAALSFHGSPSNGGAWNYTIRTDGALGGTYEQLRVKSYMMVSRPLGSNLTLPVALQSVVTSKGEPKEIERSNTISLDDGSMLDNTLCCIRRRSYGPSSA